MLQEQKESIFAKEDHARRDAQDDSDDESAISRTQSELQEVTKVGCTNTRFTGCIAAACVINHTRACCFHLRLTWD